ncbi:acyltransferase family protein [Streptomyces sp. NPDC014805]|uniref:acyltransferase family protein n=1 Tax=Streptomyces sp. NPDC014805 TaxID=3364919 RepID=UPI0036FCF42E
MIDTPAETLGSPVAGPAVRTAPPQAPDRPPRTVRLRALDGLRLVAALMVAAYHYGGRGGEVTKAWGSSPRLQFPTLHTLFAYGCLGVQIFFVISGFVICMSGWGRPLRSFFASRASRLLPAYWVAIVLVTAVMALPVLTYKTVSASETLVNFTMLQMPLGAHRVLGVCWTLWAEVRFYALFALCIVLPGATRRRVILFCACWTLAAAIAGGLNQPVLDAVVMPDYAPFFIGGMGLYLVHRDRRDPYAWGITAVNWLIGQQVAVRSLWHPATPDMFSYRSAYGVILIVTLGFLAVAAIGLGWLNWANWRWLTVAGALTYPFYLVHEHLGWPVIQALHRGLGIPSAGTFLLTVTIMLGLAWLMNKLVEERFTPKLRALLNRPAGRPDA